MKKVKKLQKKCKFFVNFVPKFPEMYPPDFGGSNRMLCAKTATFKTSYFDTFLGSPGTKMSAGENFCTEKKKVCFFDKKFIVFRWSILLKIYNAYKIYKRLQSEN